MKVDHSQIKHKQNQILYSATYVSFPSSIAVAFFLYWTIYDVAHESIILPWLSLNILVVCVRFFITSLYFKQEPDKQTKKLIAKWHNVFFAGSLASAFIWGAGLWLIYPVNHPVYEALFGVVVAGITAGAVASLSASRLSGSLYIIFCLYPLIFRFFQSSSELIFKLGIVVIVFSIFLLVSLKNINKTILNNIQLHLNGLEREKNLMRLNWKQKRHLKLKASFWPT